MSSVSSVSGGTGLYQFLQSISVNGQSQSAGATSATSATGTDPTASGGTSAVSGHHHHHHGGGGKGGDFSKVESAVTSALQSAQADGTSDPNKVIEDAIAKVFSSSSSGSTGGTGATSTTGSTGSSGSTGSTSSTDEASQQAFLKTLQSYGVDPQQFHQDFLAAIKDAQGGQVDPSTALQSFPPGSSVDTTA